MKLKNVLEKSTAWWASIKDALNACFTGIVNFVKDPFADIPKTGAKENPDKIKLNEMREKYYQRIAKANSVPNADYNQITKDITLESKQFFSSLVISTLCHKTLQIDSFY